MAAEKLSNSTDKPNEIRYLNLAEEARTRPLDELLNDKKSATYAQVERAKQFFEKNFNEDKFKSKLNDLVKLSDFEDLDVSKISVNDARDLFQAELMKNLRTAYASNENIGRIYNGISSNDLQSVQLNEKGKQILPEGYMIYMSERSLALLILRELAKENAVHKRKIEGGTFDSAKNLIDSWPKETKRIMDLLAASSLTFGVNESQSRAFYNLRSGGQVVFAFNEDRSISKAEFFYDKNDRKASLDFTNSFAKGEFMAGGILQKLEREHDAHVASKRGDNAIVKN